MNIHRLLQKARDDIPVTRRSVVTLKEVANTGLLKSKSDLNKAGRWSTYRQGYNEEEEVEEEKFIFIQVLRLLQLFDFNFFLFFSVKNRRNE